jgi:hypothetical protein
MNGINIRQKVKAHPVLRFYRLHITMAGLLDSIQNCAVFALKQGRTIHTHLPVDENQSSLFPSTISVSQSRQILPNERNRRLSSKQNLPSLILLACTKTSTRIKATF